MQRKLICEKYGGTYEGHQCVNLPAKGLNSSVYKNIKSKRSAIERRGQQKKKMLEQSKTIYQEKCLGKPIKSRPLDCDALFRAVKEEQEVLTERLNKMSKDIQKSPGQAAQDPRVKALRKEAERLHARFKKVEKDCPEPLSPSSPFCKKQQRHMAFYSAPGIKDRALGNKLRISIVQACKATGGKWKKMKSVCANNCEIYKESTCEQKVEYSCECGYQKCYYQNQCIALPEWHHAG